MNRPLRPRCWPHRSGRPISRRSRWLFRGRLRSVPFTPLLRELSRALPGLQLTLKTRLDQRGAECLKSGAVELAIAGPLGEAWSRLDAFPLFEEPFDLVVNQTHRLAGRNRAEGPVAAVVGIGLA